MTIIWVWYTVHIKFTCGKHLGVHVLLVPLALRPKSKAERQYCSQPKRDVALLGGSKGAIWAREATSCCPLLGINRGRVATAFFSSQNHSAAEFLMERREDRLFLSQPLLSSEVFSQVSITFLSAPGGHVAISFYISKAALILSF